MARITVKAISHDIEGEPETPLLSVLREQLGLAGADVAAKKAQPAADGSRAGQAKSRFSGMLHG
jgi:aerobic-type carbon monoxide dehydrogenase small subunit (CoxS/CutS family)